MPLPTGGPGKDFAAARCPCETFGFARRPQGRGCRDLIDVCAGRAARALCGWKGARRRWTAGAGRAAWPTIEGAPTGTNPKRDWR
jgi:hypothetical protein